MTNTHPMEKWRIEGGWLYMNALRANDIERRAEVFKVVIEKLKEPRPEFDYEWFSYVLQFYDL